MITTTREHPIIFTGESVRQILAGKKTQSRRVVLSNGRRGDAVTATDYSAIHYWRRGVEPGHEKLWVGCDGLGGIGHIASPFGDVGDILWVKETWSPDHRHVYPCPDYVYRADPGITEWDIQEHIRGCRATEVGVYTKTFECLKCHDFRWRSPRFMPKAACRLRLRVTGIDIERLQSITEEDAIAEGEEPAIDLMRAVAGDTAATCRNTFRARWASLNEKRAPWKSNPWVWKISFENAARSNYKSPGPVSPEPRSAT